MSHTLHVPILESVFKYGHSEFKNGLLDRIHDSVYSETSACQGEFFFTLSQGSLMECSYLIQDQNLIVKIHGDSLNAVTVSLFKEELLALASGQSYQIMVLDLSQLRFIDSAGLSALLFIQRTLSKQAKELKLAALSRPVQNIFEIVSLQRIFKVFPTVEEAIAAHA